MTDLPASSGPAPDEPEPTSLPISDATCGTRQAWPGNGWEVVKRLLFLLALSVVMIIALNMVENVVQERAERKLGVANEIGGQWGPAQSVSGPLLVIPYEVPELQPRSDDTQESRAPESRAQESRLVRHYATFLPAETRIQLKADVEKRYRSIYEVLVYTANLQMRGHFAAPNFTRWGVAPSEVKWDEASLAVVMPGTRALRMISVKLDDRPLTVEAGLLPQHPSGGGVHAAAALAGDAINGNTINDRTGNNDGASKPGLTFDIAMSFNGTGDLSVLPLGGQSEIEIASGWPHPSFIGTPLPTAREITSSGFTAHWSVSHLATGTPLSWRDGEFNLDPAALDAVGVGLTEPGDVHQQTDRIVKYGILVVGLTFGTIFVAGLLKAQRVHLMQYLLIGASLALFYLLLLSLAEQMPFGRAYLIASLVDIAIVTWYAVTTIRPLIGWLCGGVLAILHGYMFVLLQMESYALLCGTIGLLVLLVLTMIVTRKIDWYAIGEDRPIRVVGG